MPRAPLLAIAALTAAAWGGDAPASPGFADIRPLLETHCFDCHGGGKRRGGVDLARYATLDDVRKDPARWADVLRMLRDGSMPPAAVKARPTADEREKLIAWVDAMLDDCPLPKDPGHVALHRLSRAEYNNTIRDLLGVDSRPADAFPADGGGGGGFVNNADTLFIPPLLLEKLLAAAGEALDAAKDERVLTARPEKDEPKARAAAARRIVADFARRAFRRPLQAGEADRYARIAEADDKRGIAFADAVRHALKAVLVSPHFLFRVEAQQFGVKPYRIGDYELASRLSYFLWSSMPDDELFRLAEAKALHEPEEIERQVRRMLADPRARALGEDFACQWLQVEALRGAGGPDPARFRDYTPELREAMLAEPAEFFTALARDGRSALELIDCDYAWVNEPLARLYGIPGVSGAQMRKAPAPRPARGGVLGMAAVLAATSHPLRTSPVLRGKWILGQLLASPPPPPPPNIPSLPKDETAQDAQSLRQRLEAHRADAACASCHSRIDPLGFCLESYDPLGRWRDRDARDQPIDTAGALPDGQRVDGPAALRKLLLARRDDFARALAGKLLSYALGRGLEVYDRPVVKDIAAQAAAKDYSVTAMVVAVAQSYPFTFNRSAPVPPPVTEPDRPKEGP